MNKLTIIAVVILAIAILLVGGLALKTPDDSRIVILEEQVKELAGQVVCGEEDGQIIFCRDVLSKVYQNSLELNQRVAGLEKPIDYVIE